GCRQRESRPLDGRARSVVDGSKVGGPSPWLRETKSYLVIAVSTRQTAASSPRRQQDLRLSWRGPCPVQRRWKARYLVPWRRQRTIEAQVRRRRTQQLRAR